MISLPRGNSLTVSIKLRSPDGTDFLLDEGGRMIFTVKQQTKKEAPVILEKTLTAADCDPDGCLILIFLPRDTAELDEGGKYLYDIAVATADGQFYTAAVAERFSILPALSQLSEEELAASKLAASKLAASKLASSAEISARAQRAEEDLPDRIYIVNTDKKRLKASVNFTESYCDRKYSEQKAAEALEEAKRYADEKAAAERLYADGRIDGLIADAPEALDTLKELADAVSENGSITDALNAAVGEKANSADLAAVAFSGSYNDLSDIPAPSELPELADVAYTGSYNDLSDRPTIPEMPDISGKLDKSGGTMTGILYAQSNTSYTTAQVRNVTMSTSNASGGSNGQIHFKYS